MEPFLFLGLWQIHSIYKDCEKETQFQKNKNNAYLTYLIVKNSTFKFSQEFKYMFVRNVKVY